MVAGRRLLVLKTWDASDLLELIPWPVRTLAFSECELLDAARELFGPDGRDLDFFVEDLVMILEMAELKTKILK